MLTTCFTKNWESIIIVVVVVVVVIINNMAMSTSTEHLRHFIESHPLQGADSIIRCHLTSIGNPIVEISRSYDCLISTMGFPILIKWHLYIESGPRRSWERTLPLVGTLHWRDFSWFSLLSLVCAVEIWELISNFSPYFIMALIIYPYRCHVSNALPWKLTPPSICNNQLYYKVTPRVIALWLPSHFATTGLHCKMTPHFEMTPNKQYCTSYVGNNLWFCFIVFLRFITKNHVCIAEGPRGNNIVEPNVKSLFTILNDSLSPWGRGWDNCCIMNTLAMS